MSQQKLFSRSLQQLGPSTMGVSLPKQLVKYHEVKPGDEIFIADIDLENGLITFSLDGV